MQLEPRQKRNPGPLAGGDGVSKSLQCKIDSNRRRTLTQGRLRVLLHYNPATGAFTWRKDRGRFRCKGKPAGTRSRGYNQIEIDGRFYRAARLAVLYMTGAFPPSGFCVDHIDRDRSNDRWKNLRVVRHKQNAWNRSPCSRNKSGFPGVCWDRRRNKWQAFIGQNNRTLNLGFFADFDDACAARLAAERKHYGQFSRRAA